MKNPLKLLSSIHSKAQNLYKGMIKVITALQMLLLFFACQSNTTNDIILEYSIHEFNVRSNQMKVSFTLKNHSSIDFSDGWALHWNQMKGVPTQSSLPDGIKFELVNGQHYLIFRFNEDWNLNAGEELVINFQQNGIMNNLDMGPVGAFIVDAKENLFDLNIEIDWKNAAGIEDLKIPGPADKYEKLAAVSTLEKESLNWIVPSPHFIEQSKGEVTPFQNLRIFFPKELESSKEVLSGIWTKLPDFNYSFSNQQKANVLVAMDDLGHEEAYELSIKKDKIDIRVQTRKGLLYAAFSLHQIMSHCLLEGSKWPVLDIEDAPRYAYRGFMFDIARNFYGKEKIFQILDYLAYFKINHFDIRITDDEGWRIEIPGLPELTEVGAKRGYDPNEEAYMIPAYGSGCTGHPRGNGFLTTKDYVEILEYARARNIQVIPQISFPSHARAAIKAMEQRHKKFMETGDEEAAKEYLLSDQEDGSQYSSAQGYNDNVICICNESAYRFYTKVIDEIAKLHDKANHPLTVLSVGADELPYGAWQKSPDCKAFISKRDDINDISELYNYNLYRLKEILTQHQVQLAGWEDILLDHTSSSQEETSIKSETFDYEVIPYVWNNIWGEGREDMIYKFANAGFKTVMSNSAAFYFDMADDRDMDTHGLNWSGYVDYFDCWALNPDNVFGNAVLLEKHGISNEYASQKVKLSPEKKANFLGIQSQLWSETLRDEAILDELFMPNLPFFAERAWSTEPDWMQEKTASLQKEKMESDWNIFSNTIGQRTLPLIEQLYGGISYHIPKPGAKYEDGYLLAKVDFPGLVIRYTTDGSIPDLASPIVEEKVKINPKDSISLRVFSRSGKAGKPIK
jgi:hexosaminidase